MAPSTENDESVIVTNQEPSGYPSMSDEEKATVKKWMVTCQEDASWKLKARKWYALAFCLFLLIQNFFVAWFIIWAFRTFDRNELVYIQPILGILVIGSIGQTVKIVELIVKWVFSDIDYSKHPLVNNR